jgi:hypothetical protein
MNNTERHAVLIDAGWRVNVDGRWRSPAPDDWRAWTFAAAWDEHTRRDHDGTQPRMGTVKILV